MTRANLERKFELCDKRRSILNGSRHTLVMGGPGSGKTTIALLKASRYVRENLDPGQCVLFLSFSNSAIRRIVESTTEILMPEISNLLEIKTYHSFSWEILRSHGYLTSKQRQLKIVSAHDAAIQSAGLSKANWESEQTRLYCEDGLVTYDQFAPRATEILDRSNAAKECYCASYPLILVDEFQDTDEDQWALVRTLSAKSQIVALGDNDQRIYEWRDGVSDERLNEFAEELDADVYDFETENNRSARTGIAHFARSLLSEGAEVSLPPEVKCRSFPPGRFDGYLRISLINTFKETAKRTTSGPSYSIAIAARNNRMVRGISDSLSKSFTFNNHEFPPIHHDVLIDQMRVLLAGRVISNVLDCAHGPIDESVSQTLQRIADFLRAANNKTNITRSNTLQKWALECSKGKPPNTKCVTKLTEIYHCLRDEGFVGSPTLDWLSVRKKFDSSNVKDIKQTAEFSRHFRLLRRGSTIEAGLSNLWQSNGNYKGGENLLEQAVLQDQVTDTYKEQSRLTVMNMHQLKGREYDGVLLVEDKFQTFNAHETSPPFRETRRLLHMSLTRAKSFVLVLSAEGNSTLDHIFELSNANS